MGYARAIELIRQSAALGAAVAELEELASLVRIFDDGRASVTVRKADASEALIGLFPSDGVGGGLRSVPLPSTPLADVTFAGDAFTFHCRDGRSTSVTWRGAGQLDFLIPRKQQQDATYLERLFFNLRPGRSSGRAVSALAGGLTAQESEHAYYGYAGDVGAVHLIVLAIHETQLHALLPTLDRTLRGLSQSMDAARRFVVEREICTPNEAASLPICEMIFFDSGAFNLVATADAQSRQNGVDVFTIHFDVRQVPFDVSWG